MQTDRLMIESFRNKCTTNAYTISMHPDQSYATHQAIESMYTTGDLYTEVLLKRKADSLACFHGLQAQTPANLVANLALIFSPSLPPHLRGLHIGRTLIVGLSQHAHDRDENLLYALNGRPSLRSVLVVVGIIAGRMQNGDADGSIGVD